MTWVERDCGSGCKLAIEWNESSSATQLKVAPTVWRYDSYSTDNYGSWFDDKLSPDANYSMSTNQWFYGNGWGSGAGWRQVHSFNTRTYDRTTSDRTITFTLETSSEFGTWYG